MTLQPDDTLENTFAADAATPSPANTRAAAPQDALPIVLKRDSIQLLLQSPNKLFLYWSFATDPRAALRSAFGELAAHYRLAVRLVKVESGEEFVLDAPREHMQWFEVYPRHVYRADVGFHAANRPFVRLLSSQEVRTPADSASHMSAEEREFATKTEEFVRLLGGAGYESYARNLTNAPGGDTGDQNGLVDIIKNATRDDANEYPHR